MLLSPLSRIVSWAVGVPESYSWMGIYVVLLDSYCRLR